MHALTLSVSRTLCGKRRSAFRVLATFPALTAVASSCAYSNHQHRHVGKQTRSREKETGRKHLETVRRHHSFFFSRASLSHRGGLAASCAPQASNGHVTMSENIAPGVSVCNRLCLVYSAAQPARTGYNRSCGRTETKPRAGAVIQGRSARRRRRRRSEVSSW